MIWPEENSTFYDIFKLLTADGLNTLGEAVRCLGHGGMRLTPKVSIPEGSCVISRSKCLSNPFKLL